MKNKYLKFKINSTNFKFRIIIIIADDLFKVINEIEFKHRSNKPPQIKRKFRMYYGVKNDVIGDFKCNPWIDKLNDYISSFTDNNDPYPLLIFNETFDSNLIKDDTIPSRKYREIINHPMYHNKLKMFEKWKDDIFFDGYKTRT
jgi:hypothetical protein